MIRVNTHEAKTRLSRLLAAVEEQGEVGPDLPEWEAGGGDEGGFGPAAHPVQARPGPQG